MAFPVGLIPDTSGYPVAAPAVSVSQLIVELENAGLTIPESASKKTAEEIISTFVKSNYPRSFPNRKMDRVMDLLNLLT